MKIIIAIFVLLLYWKWILILLLFPSQLANAKRLKHRTLLVSLFSLPYRFVEKFLRGYARWAIYQMSTFPSRHIRKWYYIGLGAEIEQNVIFHFRTELRAPHKLKIGKGTIIGDNALLDANNGISIGKNVNLSSNVSVYSLQHNHRSPNFDCDFGSRKMSIEIDDRAWIGSNVVVFAK